MDSLHDLSFGTCCLVVAARDDSGVRRLDDVAPGSRVATVFPRITAAFFEEHGVAIEIVPVSGAAEVAPRLGIADLIVDLTSTGSTLQVNGMREVADVMVSSARLVASARTCHDRGPRGVALRELQGALATFFRARGQRYLMANVLRHSLASVREIMPGLNGPMVVDILNGGSMVAVHAVIPAPDVFRVVTALKALGAQGILITRIERLVP